MARPQNGDGELEVEEEPAEDAPLAFIGVRSCELHAIDIQDRIFLGGRFVDRDYAARREDAFIVAVNCFEPGGTCFCVSMGTGPRVEAGYDLALTEILEGEHRLLVEAGPSAAPGAARAGGRVADEADVAAADRAVEGAVGKMGREMYAGDLRELLADNLEHPRWDDVAERCLSCGNCTMVCPTCFCSSVEETTDLTGEHAERWRSWDSCFSLEHSYIHGGSVRPTARSRYRQWMTHKLGTWHDQFGTSGCVGCGRCITWCPGRDRHHRGGRRDQRGEPMVKRLDAMLADVPFLAGLRPDELALLAGCASNVHFDQGDVLFREGDPANAFYVVRHGTVALELHVPARGGMTIETIDAGEVIGWSWLFAPYRWHFDARALSRVRATAFDGECLRGKCEQDPALGYDLMKRFAQVLIERLQWTRLRLLDVYGDGR